MGTAEVKGERVVTGCVADTKLQRGQLTKPCNDVCSPFQSEAALVCGLDSKSESATKPLILSVDDDVVNQEVVKQTLSDAFEVVCTMSGHETLIYLDEMVTSEQRFPELILLDIQMPVMTGFEVCEQVRRHYGGKGATLPVMMLSAKVPVEKTAIRSFESGATDFVAKPFHPEILRKKIVALFNLKLSGDRLVGFGSAEPEACQRLSQYEMEATRAKEHTADLEAKLQETEVRAAQAIDKAQQFELELVSLKKSSDLQKTEILQLSKMCEGVLMQRKESQPLPSATKVRSSAKCELQSSDHLAIVELSSQTSCRRKVYSLSNASLVINLLLSRLQGCRKSAQMCKELLCGFLRLPVLDVDHGDTAVLEPSDSENPCSQLKMISWHTRVAISKLAMLEDVASNIGGILDMMENEDVSSDKYVSTESEALERPSRSASKASAASSTVEV
eukprot:TRINITY_DN8523_c0_g1_i2.p1 TRINITY_DN8523_c0_g1~~TRINITY_DN8523_c0_g1_i2.p1  ORF type:complete len:503 (+),score=78.92 TRINITY_DN8523_c0_g1_i2:171-1511(+)